MLRTFPPSILLDVFISCAKSADGRRSWVFSADRQDEVSYQIRLALLREEKEKRMVPLAIDGNSMYATSATRKGLATLTMTVLIRFVPWLLKALVKICAGEILLPSGCSSGRSSSFAWSKLIVSQSSNEFSDVFGFFASNISKVGFFNEYIRDQEEFFMFSHINSSKLIGLQGPFGRPVVRLGFPRDLSYKLAQVDDAAIYCSSRKILVLACTQFEWVEKHVSILWSCGHHWWMHVSLGNKYHYQILILASTYPYVFTTYS